MALSSLSIAGKADDDEQMLGKLPVRNGPAIQIRGTTQTVLCLRILDPLSASWHESLLEKVAHAPDFFHRAPIVVDLAAFGEADPAQLSGIVDRLRDMRLVPVGVQNGNQGWNDQANVLRLAVFTPQSENKAAQSKPSLPTKKNDPEPVKPPPAAKTKCIVLPVRGGQQIMSNADMIVTAPVSPGAEIAASGNIHIYAPLRGRAFAGTGGDENAMIFCDSLNAELVSVAGIHKVNEEFEQSVIGKRCRIFLKDQKLKIEPLS